MLKKFKVAANPHKKSSPARRTGKKGRKTMATQTKRKKNAHAGGKRKKNTHAIAHHRTRRRKHNPSGLGSAKELIVGGVSGLASAVATRQLPQLVLGGGNTSWQGYGANILVGIISTMIASKFAGPAAGRGAAIGSAVIVLDRVLSEQVSPIASYLSLSGVGDSQAYSKLGTIRPGFYTHPNLQNPDGSMYVPDPVTDAAMAAVVARYPSLAAPIAAAAGGRVGAVNPSSLRRHAASGMMLSSRFAGRFNQAA